MNYFTDKDYTEVFREFFGSEKKSRSGVMTSARSQPFCKNYNINISCLDGTRINPRKNTRRNITFFMYNSHFCWISKSIGVSLKKAIEESKFHFKVVDNGITEKPVKSFIKYE